MQKLQICSTCQSHWRRATDLAAFLRTRCHAGEWEGLGIDALFRRFATSESLLRRAFRQRQGCSIHAFIINERIEFSKRLLRDDCLPISEVASRSGYSCLSNFSRDFSRYTGQTPLAWRRAAAEAITTNVAPVPLMKRATSGIQ